MINVAWIVSILLITQTIAAPPSPKLVTYIDDIVSWSSCESIAMSLNVPGYAKSNNYNIINLAFWLTDGGGVDAAGVWASASTYCPNLGTTAQIQRNWRTAFHNAGKLIMVSAFGATDFPTTAGKSAAVECAKLGQFVIDNNLDGVDLDWEDNGAMEAGTGEAWLITCTNTLKNMFGNNYYISHAPQGPYFMGTSKYRNGGYLKVHQEVGNSIDWYNVQFYNQDSTTYDSQATLFTASNGWATKTAVREISSSVGQILNKLVIGKPVTQADAYNTGLVSSSDLSSWIQWASSNLGWNAGIMTWQYSSDYRQNFQFINTVSSAFSVNSLPTDPSFPPPIIPKIPPVPVVPSVPSVPVIPSIPTNPSTTCKAAYATDGDNSWWLILTSNSMSDILSVQCADGKVVPCKAETYGVFTCVPTSECSGPRNVYVNNACCSLGKGCPNNLVEDNSNNLEPTSKDTISAFAYALIGTGVVILVLLVVIVVLAKKNYDYARE